MLPEEDSTMSRAFVKEDIDVVERPTRRRSTSGLPPDATNYMTEEGADILRNPLSMLRRSHSDDATAEDIERILNSATVVKHRARSDEAAFGSTVTIQKPNGEQVTYRIVGTDEVDLHPGGVSWVSALGRALLEAKVGKRLELGHDKQAVLITSIQ